MSNKKHLKVAVQMDPIQFIDINGDSTFAMMLEAQSRGYELFHYLPSTLSLRDGQVTARGNRVSLRREQGNHYSFQDTEKVNLAEWDVVLLRQDPPFHMGYITTTHILEHIHPDTFVVNDPANVRNAPEKLLVTHFEGVMPDTLITRDPDEIKAFRAEYGDIIIKPLFGNGGAGVFRIQQNDQNMNSLIEMFEQMYPEPFMVQRYLPEVRQGDKRIILVDGEPVGAINRVPADGEARSNMHVGGKAVRSSLTDREREICDIIGPTLREKDLIFVGIDVIGDYLTEINVTSPTGIQEVDRFDGSNLAGLIWDAIEKRVNK